MTASTAAPLAPEAPWVVLKFGGTSVATVDRWRTIQQLAAARRAEGARVVVVVSALAGVTDALRALCVCAPVEREGAVAKLVGQATTAAAAGKDIWAVHPHFADADPPSLEQAVFK